MKKIVGVSALFFLVWGVTAVVRAQENNGDRSKEKSKTIEVFLHMDLLPNHETMFYMWIQHPHVSVKNTAPDLTVGYSIGHGGALYITTRKPCNLNAMYFIETPEKGKGDWRIVEVWFGGSRPNDIHIVLPEGYTAKTWTNIVTFSEKEWKRRQEDEAEQKRKDTP